MVTVNSSGSSQIHSSFELNGTSKPKVPTFGLYQGPRHPTVSHENDVAALFHPPKIAQISSNPWWSASSVGVQGNKECHENLNTAIKSQSLSKFKSLSIGNAKLPFKEGTTLLPSHSSTQAVPVTQDMYFVNQPKQQHSLLPLFSSLSLKVNLTT